MFVFVGLLIGINLAVRIALGEIREIQLRGQIDPTGKARLMPRDVAVIVYRGGMFLLPSVAIGFVLDLVFNTTVSDLFG